MKSLHRLVQTVTQLVAVAAVALLPMLHAAPADAQAVSLTLSATKAAGTDSSGTQLFNQDFGPATTVALNTPNFAAFDSLGNMYFSDTNNNCVRRMDTAGNISTVAGLAVSGQGDTCNTASNATPTPSQGLLSPTGIAVAPNGDLYIADSGHNCVRRLPDTLLGSANLVTVAGVCTATATLSQTPSPSGLALDSASNLYISVSNTVLPAQQVLRHAANATATDLCVMAGAPSVLVPLNCTGVTNTVTLNNPNGLAFNAAGELYIADTGNKCVRKIAGMTTQQTVVGQCTSDGSGSAATALNAPYGLAFTQTQAVLITDGNQVLRYMPNTGVLSLAAGLPSNASGGYDTTQDGVGAQTIPLNTPHGIVADTTNNYYVADSANHIVRMLSANNIFKSTPVATTSATQTLTFNINQSSNLSIAASSDYSIVSSTCSGAQTAATAGNPPNTCQVFVRFTPTRPGQRYAALTISDSVSNTRVAVGLQGTATGAGLQFFPGIANTVASGLSNPVAVTADTAGNAYFLEQGTGPSTSTLRRITAGTNALQTTIAAGAGLSTPTGVAMDAAGNFYIADQTAGTISRFGADGSANTSYVTGLAAPISVYVDGYGNLYISQGGAAHNLLEVYAAGGQRVVAGNGSDPAANGVPAANALFVAPTDVHIDLNGVVYIADGGGHRIYAIDRTGIIHILAGNGTTSTTTANTALGTGLVNPTSIAADAAGDLYIADQGANKVYVFLASTSSTNNLLTLMGTGAATSTGDNGLSTLATLNSPRSVAVDGSGNVFIVEAGNNAIRKITYPSPTLDFGTVLLNTTSPVKTVTFWNTGTDLLTQTGTGTFTGDTTQFNANTASSTCGASLVSGGTCDLGFTFAPTSAGTKNASLSIPSNSYNTPSVINLTGNAATGLPLTFTGPGDTEVYRQPFQQTLNATFSGTAPTGTLTFSVNGVITCTLTGTLTANNVCNAPATTLAVGTYPVLISYSGDTNYSATTVNSTLAVTPAPVSIVVDNKTKLFNTPNPTLTGTITGVASGETITANYTTTATTTSPVGSYPINATAVAGASTSLSNYNVTVTPGTLTVTAGASLTLAAPAETESYRQAFTQTLNATFGSPAPTGTVTFSVNGITTCTLSGTLSASNVCNAPATTLNVGTYNVLVSYSGDTNYSPTTTTTTLTVTPAPLTVVVNNATRTYGTANPVFTGTVTGVLPGETVNVAYSSAATVTSPAGTYPITATLTAGASTSLSNYAITNTPGVLTVTAVPTVTTIATSGSPVAASTAVTFTSTVSSTLGPVTIGTVTFTDGSTVIGTGNVNASGQVTVTTSSLTVGTHTITATYGASAGFIGSSASLSQVITAAPGSFTITASPQTQIIRGAGSKTWQVTVTSTGGFFGPVALSCSGLPADAGCTFAQTTVNLTAGGTATTTMTTTTTLNDAMARLEAPSTGAYLAQGITAASVLPFELSGIGVLLGGFRRRKPLTNRQLKLTLMVACSFIILGLAGCGCPPTANRTYTITVTGTSTLGGPAPQSTQVYLSVGLQ